MGTFFFFFKQKWDFYKILLIPCIFPLLSRTTWGAYRVPEGRPLSFFVAVLSQLFPSHVSPASVPHSSRSVQIPRNLMRCRNSEKMAASLLLASAQTTCWERNETGFSVTEMCLCPWACVCTRPVRCGAGPLSKPLLLYVLHYSSSRRFPQSGPVPPAPRCPSSFPTGRKIIWTFVFTSLIILSLV